MPGPIEVIAADTFQRRSFTSPPPLSLSLAAYDLRALIRRERISGSGALALDPRA